MTLGALLLLFFIFAILVYDWINLRGKNRRAVVLEAVLFLSGAVFIVFPGRATALAQAVGIGRGVDFFIYPTIIWLARESLVTRRWRLEVEETTTNLVRALAISEAKWTGIQGSSVTPRQSDDSSAS